MLGDYDKVKAVSEGSGLPVQVWCDPLGEMPASGSSGDLPEGRLLHSGDHLGVLPASVPVAPQSALNPCEETSGSRSREADSRDLKVGPGGGVDLGERTHESDKAFAGDQGLGVSGPCFSL